MMIPFVFVLETKGVAMKSAVMRFDGALLKRGFWLYVWKISQGKKTVLYVGRTGDTSSPFAASPFSRVSRHLDVREKAKGNTLYRQLGKVGFSPERCEFEMFAFDTGWKEQQTMATHRKYRDKTAALERALADLLSKDHTVVGNHPQKGIVDRRKLNAIFAEVAKKLDS
jgi:hypothetical protein